MNKETKMIPKLRFPEFENEGQWEEIKLKQAANFYRGLTYGKNDTSDSGLLVLRSGNIQNDTLVLDKDLVFVNKKCSDDLKLLQGDVVICMSNGSKALVGKNADYQGEYDGKITVGAFCSIMRPKNKFITYILKTDAYQSFISLSIGGGNINNLKNSDLEEYECAVPSTPEEQQKIASCLSSLDELIAAHNDKLDTLKDHKKGLLQNLFPQEGETVPKVRFSEFEGDGEWVDRELGNEIEYFKGFAFKSKDYTSNGRRIVRVSDMGFDYVKDEDKAIYINEDDAVQYEKWELAKDDLIITTVGSKPPVYDSLVGRTIVVQEKDSRSLLNQNAVCLRAKKIKQNFFNYLFERNEYINFIESIIRGNANQGSITLENLFKYQIRIPESKEEQQKIASCLLAVDELITAQKEKIEQLQQHKKGLMQGLFPKIES